MSRFARRTIEGVAGTIGAGLYMTPASGSFTNGSSVVITIRESSQNTAVNAVQANFTYPTGMLQFQSISTSGSPFTTTVQSSGGSGSVNIGVGLLGSSVTGDQLVATVTFTAVGTGSAAAVFASGCQLNRASDSSDICSYKHGASYTIS